MPQIQRGVKELEKLGDRELEPGRVNKRVSRWNQTADSRLELCMSFALSSPIRFLSRLKQDTSDCLVGPLVRALEFSYPSFCFRPPPQPLTALLYTRLVDVNFFIVNVFVPFAGLVVIPTLKKHAYTLTNTTHSLSQSFTRSLTHSYKQTLAPKLLGPLPVDVYLTLHTN